MSAITSLLISVAANLVTPVFENYTSKISNPMKQLAVRTRLDSVAMSAFASLESYFRVEIPAPNQEEKILRLVGAANDIVLSVWNEPKKLLESSLNAEKFVSVHLEENGFPEVVSEDQTTTAFVHFLTACVRMMLELPHIMNEWEQEAWITSFSKLDALANLVEDQTRLVTEMQGLLTANFGSARQGMAALKASLLQADARSNIEVRGLTRVQVNPLTLHSIFVAPKLTAKARIAKVNSNSLNSEEDLLEFFSRTGMIFRVFGEAGSGKTTLTRWLEQKQWQVGDRLALRIELRSVAQSEQLPNILDLVDGLIPRARRGTLERQEIKSWMDEGRILFVYDGFDEIPIPKRTSILNWIHANIVALNDGNSHLLTSRPITTNHLDDSRWKGTASLQIDGFDKKRVETYIGKWQQSMLSQAELAELPLEETPNELATSFTHAETIKELTANPLLLSTLMMVHGFEGKRLPDSRSDLYRIYVDGMLGQWYAKTQQKDAMHLDAPVMRRLLRSLAVRMQVTESPTLAADVAVECLEPDNKTKYSTKDVLEHMLERTGLLIGPGEYQFAHKSIGEFLVAEAIVSEKVRDGRLPVDRLYLLKRAPLDSWRVVLFLWAGLVPSKLDLIDFCCSLNEKGHVGVSLGLLYEFFDELVSDHPKELTEVLHEAFSATRDLTSGDQQAQGQGTDSVQTTGMRLFNAHFDLFPGNALLARQPYLTIKGDGGHEITLNQKLAEHGLVRGRDWALGRGTSSYYTDLWLSWVADGEPVSTLFDIRPQNLSFDQATTLIVAIKDCVFEIHTTEPSFNPIFYVPFLAETILRQIYLPRKSNKREKLIEKHCVRIAAFLERYPISGWHDVWFGPLVSESKANLLEEIRGRVELPWVVEPSIPHTVYRGPKRNLLNDEVVSTYVSERRKRTRALLERTDSFEVKFGLVMKKRTPGKKTQLPRQSFNSIFGDSTVLEAKKLLDHDNRRCGTLGPKENFNPMFGLKAV
nr:NACHT domain-containing protein [uncultured Shimia sp.]